MTARLQTALCILVFPVGLFACGKDCQSTCTTLYGTAPNCGDPKGDFKGLVNNDQTRDEKMTDCMRACKDGLAKPGEVGDYDPYTKFEGEEPPTLENDRQVALWMECIDDHSCPKIADGFCQPTW
jgi:hypothetical protein